MRSKRSIPAVGFAVGMILAGASLAQTQGPVTGDAEHGALLYYQHSCYGCHGFSGYGRQDLNNTGSAMLINEEVFTAFMRGRQDVAPLLPATNMPNYPANALSDEEVKDIYAYIRSMPRNEPETASIPAFRTILDSANRPYNP